MRRLIAGGLVCISIYPALMGMIHLTWYRGLAANDFVRTEPLMLAQDWAEEMMGERSAEKKRRADLLAPLPLWKMAERFAGGMAKGFTPLYLLAAIGGIAVWWRVWRRRDYQPLVYTAGLIFLAIWVHLYWSHEAGARYFFPVVMVSLPFVALGALKFSAALAKCFRQPYLPAAKWMAAAAPLAIVLAVNLSVSLGCDCRQRAATVELGRWVQEQYGPTARIFGPDGETQVVNYYAQGRCDSFPEAATEAAVVKRIGKLRPQVILLAADPRTPERNAGLQDRVEALGFATIDRSRFEGQRLLVLAKAEESKVGWR